MHEIVTALHVASDADLKYGLAFLLFSESAANVLESFNLAYAASEVADAVPGFG
jgi:hypothetical protein